MKSIKHVWKITGSPSFELSWGIDLEEFVWVITYTELCKILYGRIFVLRVNSKYVDLNGKNEDHLLLLRNSEIHNFPIQWPPDYA